MEHHISFTFI